MPLFLDAFTCYANDPIVDTCHYLEFATILNQTNCPERRLPHAVMVAAVGAIHLAARYLDGGSAEFKNRYLLEMKVLPHYHALSGQTLLECSLIVVLNTSFNWDRAKKGYNLNENSAQ